MECNSIPLPDTLHTERLTLRFVDPGNENDCKQILHVYYTSGMTNYTLDTIHHIHTRHKSFAPQSGWCTKAPAPDRLFHLIFLKSNETDPDPVGFIGMNFRPGMPCLDIGYVLVPRYRGRGYATEAAREVLRFWREEVGVKEICAAIGEGNPKSARTAESLGLKAGGNLWIEAGSTEEPKRIKAVAYVLEGMEWRDIDGEGEEWVLRPAVKLSVGGKGIDE